MGIFVGYILLGGGFVLFGLWYLYNVVGGYVCFLWSYKIWMWFFFEGLGRCFWYVEFYFIIVGVCGFIVGELLFDRFWFVIIYFNNFEYVVIFFILFFYVLCVFVVDVF